jgi:uncharacterized protein (DUF488 family)
MSATNTIYTIGHSTRSLTSFIGILKAFRVTTVIDIRAIPQSRHNPQFGRETLSAALEGAGIHYLHCNGLGGFRKTQKDSMNTGWISRAFRGFADYMQTLEFAQAIRRVQDLAAMERVVLMCTEGNPYRCHRRLVSDALISEGVRVEHISGPRSSRAHTLTAFARVEGGRISYPAPEERRTTEDRQGILK